MLHNYPIPTKLPTGTNGQYIGYDANNDPSSVTPDSSPAQGSGNLVISGGVYSALTQKSDKVEEITISTEGAVTQALTAGKIYHFTGEEISTLTITLAATNDLAQYHFDVNSNNTAVTLVLPDSVNIDLEGTAGTGTVSYTLDINTHYEFDILNGFAIASTWEIPPIIQALLFSSPSTFTLATANSTKNWNGTLETSTDGSTWTTWAGTSAVSSSNDGKLYVRGSNNTIITGAVANPERKWILTGSNISCDGDIRNLLNYTDKSSATMSEYCFFKLFKDNSTLISAPKLPLLTTQNYCYAEMFENCTSLMVAPELPATTLNGYQCYSLMFYGCTSLIVPPKLPATTVTSSCYSSMFNGCTNLTSIPMLPATVLKNYCYNQMFKNCTKIKLSTVQDGDYTIPYQTIPYGGDTSQTPASVSQAANMFDSTGGTFTGTPSSNTMYYLHKDCSIVPAN